MPAIDDDSNKTNNSINEISKLEPNAPHSSDNDEVHSTFSRNNIGTDKILTHIKSINGENVSVTGDVDEAMEYALEAEGEKVDISPQEEKRLLIKIDLFLLPLICLLYTIQYMDKISISYAAVMGLRDHYHMHGNQYSWCGSI